MSKIYSWSEREDEEFFDTVKKPRGGKKRLDRDFEDIEDLYKFVENPDEDVEDEDVEDEEEEDFKDKDEDKDQ